MINETSTPKSPDAVSEAIAKAQADSPKSAYQLTLICCEAIARSGERIPAWPAIRELIGKGSANDINRAKKDYYASLGQKLRQSDENLSKLPSELTEGLVTLWQKALNEAHATYSEDRKQDDARVNDALTELEETENRYTVVLKNNERLESDVKHLSQTNALLSEQLSESKANAANNAKRLAAQISELETQLQKAFTEFEHEAREQAEVRGRYEDDIQQKNSLLDERQAALAQLRRKYKELEGINLSTTEKLQRITELLDQSNSALAQLRSEHTLLVSERDLLASKFSDQEIELAHLRESLTQAQKQEQNYLGQLSALREELASRTGALDVLSSDNERLRQTVDERSNENKILIAKVATLEASNKQLEGQSKAQKATKISAQKKNAATSITKAGAKSKEAKKD